MRYLLALVLLAPLGCPVDAPDPNGASDAGPPPNTLEVNTTAGAVQITAGDAAGTELFNDGHFAVFTNETALQTIIQFLKTNVIEGNPGSTP